MGLPARPGKGERKNSERDWWMTGAVLVATGRLSEGAVGEWLGVRGRGVPDGCQRSSAGALLVVWQ